MKADGNAEPNKSLYFAFCDCMWLTVSGWARFSLFLLGYVQINNGAVIVDDFH